MIEITKSNYKNYNFHDIVAFSCASPGAMGNRGAVVIVTTKGCVYYTNPYFGDISLEEVEEICPPLKECRFGVFCGGTFPEGWQSFYMGCGNHLLINDTIASRFHEIFERESIQKKVYLINRWLDIVLEIIGEKPCHSEQIQNERESNEI